MKQRESSTETAPKLRGNEAGGIPRSDRSLANTDSQTGNKRPEQRNGSCPCLSRHNTLCYPLNTQHNEYNVVLTLLCPIVSVSNHTKALLPSLKHSHAMSCQNFLSMYHIATAYNSLASQNFFCEVVRNYKTENARKDSCAIFW